MPARASVPRTPSVVCDCHLSPSASVVLKRPAALRSVRCWVVPGRDSSSSAGSVRRVPSLHSAVSLRLVYTWPLFLQALCLFRLVRGPRYAAVRARLQSHKAFRAARRQASRLLAQRVPTVIKMRRFSRKYTLRRWDSAGLRLQRSTAVRASEPSRLRAGRPSVLPHRRSLPLLQGA